MKVYKRKKWDLEIVNYVMGFYVDKELEPQIVDKHLKGFPTYTIYKTNKYYICVTGIRSWIRQRFMIIERIQSLRKDIKINIVGHKINSMMLHKRNQNLKCNFKDIINKSQKAGAQFTFYDSEIFPLVRLNYKN